MDSNCTTVLLVGLGQLGKRGVLVIFCFFQYVDKIQVLTTLALLKFVKKAGGWANTLAQFAKGNKHMHM